MQASLQGVSAQASGCREAPLPLVKADAAQVDVGPRLACGGSGWSPVGWLLGAELTQRPIQGTTAGLPEESGLDVGSLGSAPAQAPGSTAEPQGQAHLGPVFLDAPNQSLAVRRGGPCRGHPGHVGPRVGHGQWQFARLGPHANRACGVPL